MWGGFAFGVLGATLAALFLRGVGVVGHTQQKSEDEDEGSEKGEGHSNVEDGKR